MFHRSVVELEGGPLSGHTIPVLPDVLARPEFHHGIHQPSQGINGILWSYAHRWPTRCPRYVLTPGSPNTARWRGITDAEYQAGEAAEAAHMHWKRVLHPLPYALDVAFYASQRLREQGVEEDRATRFADDAVYLARRRDGADRIFRRGTDVPHDVDYLADVRGNLQVRVGPGREQWFQPGPDDLTIYPDGHIWVPPIRYTSEILRKGPAAAVPRGLITDADEKHLDDLRRLAVSAVGHRG